MLVDWKIKLKFKKYCMFYKYKLINHKQHFYIVFINNLGNIFKGDKSYESKKNIDTIGNNK